MRVTSTKKTVEKNKNGRAFERAIDQVKTQRPVHYPTPWRYTAKPSEPIGGTESYRYDATIYDANGVTVATHLTDGNAAMIVHAMNLHHDLMMSLRNVLDPMRKEDGMIDSDVDTATDVLLKAVRGPC